MSDLGDGLLADALALSRTLADILRKLVLKVLEMLIVLRWLVLVQNALYVLRAELLLALQLM